METKETQCHTKPAVNATCLLGNKGCYENGKCHYMGNCEHKVLTNADRIRAMSDEELRDFLFNKVSVDSICNFCVPKMRTERKCDGHCKNGILEWLKQPADMRGEEE